VEDFPEPVGRNQHNTVFQIGDVASCSGNPVGESGNVFGNHRITMRGFPLHEHIDPKPAFTGRL